MDKPKELDQIRTKKKFSSINYGIIINTIIILSMVFFIFFCYMIGSILANPLVVLGIIILFVLISLYNYFSILEKQNEMFIKNSKTHQKEVRN